MTLIAEEPAVRDTRLPPVDVLEFAWRNRTSVLVVTLAAALAAAAVSLVLPHRYTTVASFVADQGSSTPLSSSLLGFASSFGIPLGGGTTASPQFYATVAKSERILDAVAAYDRYPLPDGGEGRLAGTLGTTHDRQDIERARTLKKLRGLAVATAEPRTGIVQIVVTARTAPLAAAIGQRFLAAIDSFNVHIRTSRGAAEVSFVERRLAQAADSLREAERELARFRMANRVASTPELELELGRLQRGVDFRQSVYVALAQQYEQAKIAAQRDVPAITVIERAEPPVQRSFPRRKLIVIGATVVSAVGWVLVLVALRLVDPVYPRHRWPRWLAANLSP